MTSRLLRRKGREAVSRLNQNGVAEEMESNAAGGFLSVKVNSHGVNDLFLQIPEVFALRGDAARPVRCVPGGYEPSGFLIPLNLKSDFVHRF